MEVSSAISKNNPYRDLVYGFPGRIFPFDSFESDKQAVIDLCHSKRLKYCEIGSGSGMHLIGQAVDNPEALFFGIERRYKRAVRTIEKSIQGEVDNTYVLRINAQHIREIFSEKIFDGVFILFPDPWERPKRWKQRVLSKEFLNVLHRFMKEGAVLIVKTDHQDYFDAFLKCLEDTPFHMLEESRDLFKSELVKEDESNISSEFESLFRSQNKPIHYAKLEA